MWKKRTLSLSLPPPRYCLAGFAIRRGIFFFDQPEKWQWPIFGQETSDMHFKFAEGRKMDFTSFGFSIFPFCIPFVTFFFFFKFAWEFFRPIQETVSCFMNQIFFSDFLFYFFPPEISIHIYTRSLSFDYILTSKIVFFFWCFAGVKSFQFLFFFFCSLSSLWNWLVAWESTSIVLKILKKS